MVEELFSTSRHHSKKCTDVYIVTFAPVNAVGWRVGSYLHLRH